MAGDPLRGGLRVVGGPHVRDAGRAAVLQQDVELGGVHHARALPGFLCAVAPRG